MAQFTHLRDLYAFPGFVPAAHVHGLFGDPFAVVVHLHRRQKKLPVEYAAPSIAPSTISPFATSATSTAADDASTSKFPSVASRAAGVGP
jgi:hypothetical protein